MKDNFKVCILNHNFRNSSFIPIEFNSKKIRNNLNRSSIMEFGNIQDSIRFPKINTRLLKKSSFNGFSNNNLKKILRLHDHLNVNNLKRNYINSNVELPNDRGIKEKSLNSTHIKEYKIDSIISKRVGLSFNSIIQRKL